jgi:hypothetical protein
VQWTQYWGDRPQGATAHYRQKDGTTLLDILTPGKQPKNANLEMFHLPMRSGARYLVQFRARADRERPITLRVHEHTPPHQPMGLEQEVDLDREWRAFRYTFTASETDFDGLGGLSVYGGHAPGRVELADLLLVELSENESSQRGSSVAEQLMAEVRAGRTPDEATNLLRSAAKTVVDWQFGTGSETVRASYQQETGGVARVHVRVPGSKNWQVMLTKSDLPLRSGEKYVLQFRARADAWRRATVRVQNGIPNWEQTGTSQMIALDREWRAFRFHFTASAEAVPDRGSLNFLLSHDAGVYWIADVVLAPVKPERVPPELLAWDGSAPSEVVP